MTSKNTCGTGLFHDCTHHGKHLSTEHTLYRRFSTSRRAPLLVEGVKTARTNPNLDLYRKLQKKRNALFSFLQESYPELTNCPCVTMDDFGGGILLTRHLLATGHTRIGAIFPADMRSGLCAARGCCIPCGTQVHFRKIP